MKNIAIIPARSGSRGLPDKNIKMLQRKPLLAYSVEAAQRSGMFDIIHVSTDAEEYAEIAKAYGADVPFLRSTETSSDLATSLSVVLEVLNKYSRLGRNFDNVMLLQPTSPLRTSSDIIAAFTLMNTKKANSVVSVCRADHPPTWYHILSPDGSMNDFVRTEKSRRRQDANVFYRVNGAIFLTRTVSFFQSRDLCSSPCFAYIMDKKNSVDIDDELDFLFAEAVLFQAP